MPASLRRPQSCSAAYPVYPPTCGCSLPAISPLCCGACAVTTFAKKNSFFHEQQAVRIRALPSRMALKASTRMTPAQTPPCLLAFKRVLDEASSLSCSSLEEQHACTLLENVRGALRSFHGVQEQDGLLFLRVLAKELYELTIAWAKKVSCKQVVDLKLLSCRLQEYSLVSTAGRLAAFAMRTRPCFRFLNFDLDACFLAGPPER